MMSAMTTTWDAAAFDAFERSGWAGRSEAYESGFARLTAHTVGPLLDAAGVTSGTEVLDVGTGPGVVAAAALARGAVVTAVDASPEMAALATAACPGADVRIAVLPELPFADGSFDAVVGNFVINHLGDAASGLAELQRFAATVTKPSFIRDDLLVKVQTADHVDTGGLVAQLTERAAFAEAKIGLFDELLRKMRGDRSEEEYLRHGERIGPYLTCLRGLAFEQGNRDWCARAVTVLRERTAHARP